MEQEERWNQFAASGRVMDYLKYRESVNDWESSQTASNSTKTQESALAGTGADAKSAGRFMTGSSRTRE